MKRRRRKQQEQKHEAQEGDTTGKDQLAERKVKTQISKATSHGRRGKRKQMRQRREKTSRPHETKHRTHFVRAGELPMAGIVFELWKTTIFRCWLPPSQRSKIRVSFSLPPLKETYLCSTGALLQWNTGRSPWPQLLPGVRNSRSLPSLPMYLCMGVSQNVSLKLLQVNTTTWGEYWFEGRPFWGFCVLGGPGIRLFDFSCRCCSVVFLLSWGFVWLLLVLQLFVF